MTPSSPSAPPVRDARRDRTPAAHARDVLLERLSAAAVAATLVLIAAGGLVRATRSGLGCPDWPRCHGGLLPPGDYHAIIEFSHRAVAGISGVLVLAVAVVALARHRREPRMLWPSLVAVGLIGWQAYLGRLVVLGELRSSSVAIHLFTALVLLALLLYVAFAARFPPGTGTGSPPPVRRLRRWVVVVGTATLVTLVTGAYVTGTGAAWSVKDWPLVRGDVFPPRDLHGVLVYLHRLLAGLAALGAVVTWRVGRASGDRDLARLTALAAALYGLQVLFGAGNALLGMPAPFVVLHVATGALIWAAYVWTYLAAGQTAGVPRRSRSTVR